MRGCHRRQSKYDHHPLLVNTTVCPDAKETPRGLMDLPVPSFLICKSGTRATPKSGAVVRMKGTVSPAAENSAWSAASVQQMSPSHFCPSLPAGAHHCTFSYRKAAQGPHGRKGTVTFESQVKLTLFIVPAPPVTGLPHGRGLQSKHQADSLKVFLFKKLEECHTMEPGTSLQCLCHKTRTSPREAGRAFLRAQTSVSS